MSKDSLVPPERGDVSLLTGGLLFTRASQLVDRGVVFQVDRLRWWGSGDRVIFKCFHFILVTLKSEEVPSVNIKYELTNFILFFRRLRTIESPGPEGLKILSGLSVFRP